ncbi:MAG: hypothetical protein M3463_00255 [Verrucomicrobiota bacterium]|nr:hypothetical protein [Verrucomicrobiota bacterium]
MSRETKVKLDAAIGNWKAITPELLQDPANSDLLQELRVLARNPLQTAARVPLIKLGDEEVINSCLEEYRVTTPNSRGSAMTQLGLAGNPKVIPLLAADLNIEESPQRIFFEDHGMLPLSMASAAIIKAIVLNSAVFSDEVKAWAGRLPRATPGLRDGVRVWWAINKAALERGDYQAVVPVAEPPAASVIPKATTPSPTISAMAPQVTPTASTSPVSATIPNVPGSPSRGPVLVVMAGILAVVMITALVWKLRV